MWFERSLCSAAARLFAVVHLHRLCLRGTAANSKRLRRSEMRESCHRIRPLVDRGAELPSFVFVEKTSFLLTYLLVDGDCGWGNSVE
jgi:hypothetical protein